jgi:NAD(P)H-dependent FMN reductase
MNTLKIITSTTRQERRGRVIADWITRLAEESNKFEVELLDLAEIALPFMDEPNYPSIQQYQHDHTKKWSETIASSDAFIIVLAEYNFGFPAPIKNALDYLFNEWKHKPVGFVSYGGMSGGVRSAQMLKPIVTALSMMPLAESVSLPFFTKHINNEDVFVPHEDVTNSAYIMLNELARWSSALKPLRQ